MNDVVLVRCAGCGLPLGNQVPSEGALKHVRECERHPLAAEIRDFKATVEHLDQELRLAKAAAAVVDEQASSLLDRAEKAERERDAARANLDQARQDLSAETAARVQVTAERDAARGAPITRSDWQCCAGTRACPGTQGSLRKDWICGACGRKAEAPKTWRDQGLASKPKTYEPDAASERLGDPEISDAFTPDAPGSSFKVNVAKCSEIRSTNGCVGVACPECPAASPNGR